MFLKHYIKIYKQLKIIALILLIINDLKIKFKKKKINKIVNNYEIL